MTWAVLGGAGKQTDVTDARLIKLLHLHTSDVHSHHRHASINLVLVGRGGVDLVRDGHNLVPLQHK